MFFLCELWAFTLARWYDFRKHIGRMERLVS